MVNKKIIVLKDDVRYNISVLKKEVKTKIIAVIKGDGYGLGLIDMAKLLKECDIDFFAVSEAEEALSLRKAGITEESILLLTPSYKEEEISELIETANDIIENPEKYQDMCKRKKLPFPQ